jgi:hypothetical protein
MKINNFKISNVSAETTIDNNSRIGSKILEFGLVTIDYKNKKFYFLPYNQNIDANEKKFPIDFVPSNNQLFVSFVWDNNLTDKISKGDQIIAIDDINYEKVSICEVIVKNPILKDKHSVKLTTRNQKGEQIETVIERK